MSGDQTEAVPKQLRGQLDYFEETFAAGDLVTLADSFCTGDAVVEGYGMPPQIGRIAIVAAFLANVAA